MVKITYLTSESVAEGHPDKICDHISDAVLDNLIAQDPKCHAAVECMCTTGSVVVVGEITTTGYADIAKIVRDVCREIGYTDVKYGLDCEDCGVFVNVHGQSPDIAMGVVQKEEMNQGAGDQGMMYGFACSETPELMPLTIVLAHQLVARQSECRRNGTITGLGPDAKSQVSVEYHDGVPKRVSAVVLSSQHLESKSLESVRADVLEHIIRPVLGKWFDNETKVHINPTGRFVIGGPKGDSGLTGRKIIVDSYGGIGRHGGGAFSGKDPSKVDRSGAYAARYVAKNIVAAGLATKCEVQISYAIGVAEPTSVNVDTFGTNAIPEERINELVRKNFDLRPRGIIKMLNLLRPIYYKTARYGHFGRNLPEFTWEHTDVAPRLREQAGLAKL